MANDKRDCQSSRRIVKRMGREMPDAILGGGYDGGFDSRVDPVRVNATFSEESQRARGVDALRSFRATVLNSFTLTLRMKKLVMLVVMGTPFLTTNLAVAEQFQIPNCFTTATVKQRIDNAKRIVVGKPIRTFNIVDKYDSDHNPMFSYSATEFHASFVYRGDSSVEGKNILLIREAAGPKYFGYTLYVYTSQGDYDKYRDAFFSNVLSKPGVSEVVSEDKTYDDNNSEYILLLDLDEENFDFNWLVNFFGVSHALVRNNAQYDSMKKYRSYDCGIFQNDKDYKINRTNK